MKKFILLGILVFCTNCTSFGNRLYAYNSGLRLKKIQRIICFSPEIDPNLEEIYFLTDYVFFSAITDKMYVYGSYNVVRLNAERDYENPNILKIKELCKNNYAQAAVLAKVKYIKVGLGKYVFSNQAIVSLKLYNDEGIFMMETSYNTYTGNARLLGSAENSVKIGTKKSLEKMVKELRNKRMFFNGKRNW